MSKKIVISFPGGRGAEVPLLYFAAKHYEDLGYEKVFISHPISKEYSFEALLDNADKIVKEINFCEYEDIVFVAKSIGTGVACTIKERYQISATLILFTPPQETLPFIKRDNDITLVAIGTKDKYVSSDILKEMCEKEGICCYVENGVGHRMEVMNDLQRNLEIISNVIEQIK